MKYCWISSRGTRQRSRSSFTDRKVGRAITGQVLAQAVVSGISIGAIFGLIGLGFSLTYRATKVINFGHGSLVVLGLYVTYTVTQVWHQSLWLATLCAVATVASVMALVEVVALRPLYSRQVVYPILSTVGLSIGLAAAIQLTWGSEPRFIPGILAGHTVSVGGVIISSNDIAAFGISIVIAGALLLVIERTRLGRALRTVAEDSEVAVLLGISPRRAFTVVLALSGGLAAVAAVMLGSRVSLSPTLGISLGIAGFAAAVIGGLGNPFGAMAGGMLLGVIENLAVFYITPNYKDAVAYALIAIMLLLRPQGIFGERRGVVRDV